MAVAIIITQEIKDNNPTLQWVQDAELDSIVVRGVLPSVFNNTLNYNSVNNADNQNADGWRDVVQPTIDNDTQKRGGIIFDEVNDVFTYNVVDLTQEEIDARIPTEISKLNFKLGLLINHGITNDNVLAVINSVEDNVQREMLKLLWQESNVIDRTDENLLAFAPALGLTENDLKVIHRDFANYR